MKPNNSQTISRLVCTMRAMLNGMAGKGQVANHVLQAQRDAKDDLAGKQCQGRDEVQLGDPLRLVFECCSLHVCILGCCSVGDQPSILGGHFSVDDVGPAQELDQIVELCLGEVELRHLAATRVCVGMALIQALMKSGPRRL
jgi:hypothetical protein